MANNNLGQESIAQERQPPVASLHFTQTPTKTPTNNFLVNLPECHFFLNQNPYNPNPNAYLPHCIKPLAQTEGQRPSTNVILSIQFLQHL